MPELSTDLHLAMLRNFQRRNTLPLRVIRGFSAAFRKASYGDEWGVIDSVPPLRFFLERWVEPYVNPNQVAIEIGPGGGRWTRHLFRFRVLYLVDYHQEVLDHLARVAKRQKNCVYVKNAGTDFPGIKKESVDFCFSFGVFVHLEFDLIEQYLDSLRLVMRPGGNVVIQFSDKRKTMALENEGFSDNNPARMHEAIRTRGFEILESDDTLFWHSSVVRFAVPI